MNTIRKRGRPAKPYKELPSINFNDYKEYISIYKNSLLDRLEDEEISEIEKIQINAFLSLTASQQNLWIIRTICKDFNEFCKSLHLEDIRSVAYYELANIKKNLIKAVDEKIKDKEFPSIKLF